MMENGFKGFGVFKRLIVTQMAMFCCLEYCIAKKCPYHATSHLEISFVTNLFKIA